MSQLVAPVAAEAASGQADVVPLRAALRAMHLAALGAEPAEERLVSLEAEIGQDAEALAALGRTLHAFAGKLQRLASPALPDHSQHGELAILLRELVTAGSRHGIIVDVGAHGSVGSNSYDLLTDFGWTGLLIEPNPALLPRIRDEFGSANYTLLGCAIGVTAGVQTLHLGIGEQISSLLFEQTAKWGEVTAGVEVTVRRLPDVLAEQKIPHDFDILSIDIEGIDVAVVNDLIATSPYRPGWIVIEEPVPLFADPLAASALSDEVKSLYSFADRTMPNLVLRRR